MTGPATCTATAIIAAPAAIPQPASRSGTEEAGAARETGRIKASSSAVAGGGQHRADDTGEQDGEAD